MSRFRFGGKNRSWIPLACGAGAVLWLLVVLVGVVPTWKRVKQNEQDILTAEKKTVSFSEMAVAGIWIQEATRWREWEFEGSYDRLFTHQKDLDGLFLDLARIARSSGVEPLRLQEVTTGKHSMLRPAWENTNTDAGRNFEQLIEELGSAAPRVPDDRLKPHRLRAVFESEYGGLVRFLEGLKGIRRALTVGGLRIEPSGKNVKVDLELEFYVRAEL